MKNIWYWAIALTLISLLFITIPISYSGRTQREQLRPEFEEYVRKFNKSYHNDPVEFETRFDNFLVSLEEINKLNKASHGPEEHRARYGLTVLSDMSKSEYKDVHMSDERMTNPPEYYGKSWHDHRKHRHHNSETYNIVRAKRAMLPLQVDWRLKNVVGAIKTQGLCGACWAFTTVGVVESMAAIQTSKLQSLSVQEAIDCARLGNHGCRGGDICLLLDWLLISRTALVPETDYPLRLTDGVCRLRKNTTGVLVKSFTCDDFVGAEDKILEALALHGPVGVAVNALTWQNYLGGVIQYHCSGALEDLNHAVELVGYNLSADVPYYIAKNSWGSDFGNEGYLKLAVGGNICGLASEVATIDVQV